MSYVLALGVLRYLLWLARRVVPRLTGGDAAEVRHRADAIGRAGVAMRLA